MFSTHNKQLKNTNTATYPSKRKDDQSAIIRNSSKTKMKVEIERMMSTAKHQHG